MLGTYHRLNVTVWASDREVIRRIRDRFSKEAFHPELRDNRKRIYRQMLEYHHNAQALCLEFRL